MPRNLAERRSRFVVKVTTIPVFGILILLVVGPTSQYYGRHCVSITVSWENFFVYAQFPIHFRTLTT